jgi:alpha-galactosidase
VELPDGQVLFLGALGLESHVTLDGQSLVGRYETGNGEWLLTTGDETEFMSRYAELLGERLGKGCRASISSPGFRSVPDRIWCSWYSLYNEISETQMLKILSDLGPFENTQGLPFDVFQIDDGWQVGIGDWEPNAKFFSGMDKLATQIHGTGRKAGLWLAPLLIVPSSNIYREHRDWLLHEENGSLVSAGFNWGEPLYALDTTHPTALYWLVDLMKKVRGWGYDYAKLDFLYAGALPGKRYLDIPRETAYRNGLRTIRGALGDAYLLTCGAPILPSIGLCDGIRVGPDMAGHFTSHLDDDLIMNFATPGGRNALRTSFNRLWLQPLVHTDPDVVYFRSRQSNLTPKQKSLLEDMAQICNFKATSDIPAWLTDSERYSLREFLESRPEVRKTGRTTYQIGDHEVDFALYIDLPPLPGPLTNLLGVIVGGLANIPFVLRLLDWLGRRSVRKTLAKDPV